MGHLLERPWSEINTYKLQRFKPSREDLCDVISVENESRVVKIVVELGRLKRFKAIYLIPSDNEANQVELLAVTEILYAVNLSLVAPNAYLLPYFYRGGLDCDQRYRTSRHRPKKDQCYLGRMSLSHEVRRPWVDPWELGLDKAEYLNELESYQYCLCARGYGLDSFRFWETILLGSKPVLCTDGIPEGFLVNLTNLLAGLGLAVTREPGWFRLV